VPHTSAIRFSSFSSTLPFAGPVFGSALLAAGALGFRPPACPG
jgi:hypothetical protein